MTKWCTKVRKSMTKFQFWPCFCTYKFMCALQKGGLRRTGLIRSVKLILYGEQKWENEVQKFENWGQKFKIQAIFVHWEKTETQHPNFFGDSILEEFFWELFGKVDPPYSHAYMRRLELSKAQRNRRRKNQRWWFFCLKYNWPTGYCDGNCTTTPTPRQSHLPTETESQQLFQTRLDFTVITTSFVSKFRLRTDNGWRGGRPDDKVAGGWQMMGKNAIAYAWFNMCRKLIQLRSASQSEVLLLAKSDLFMEQGSKQVRAMYEMMTGVWRCSATDGEPRKWASWHRTWKLEFAIASEMYKIWRLNLMDPSTISFSVLASQLFFTIPTALTKSKMQVFQVFSFIFLITLVSAGSALSFSKLTPATIPHLEPRQSSNAITIVTYLPSKQT